MLTYGNTVVGISTTVDVTRSYGETYIFAAGAPERPSVIVGTGNVVTLSHTTRDSKSGYD